MNETKEKKTFKQNPLHFLRVGLMHKTDVDSVSKQGGNSITLCQRMIIILRRYKNELHIMPQLNIIT